jgi:hypothetical protein
VCCRGRSGVVGERPKRRYIGPLRWQRLGGSEEVLPRASDRGGDIVGTGRCML